MDRNKNDGFLKIGLGIVLVKTEEAVYDVKRSAMAELHKALVVERARAERLVAEARRQGAEETLLALGRHSHAKEVRIYRPFT